MVLFNRFRLYFNWRVNVRPSVRCLNILDSRKYIYLEVFRFNKLLYYFAEKLKRLYV